ncbi:hydroxypyruvate isomerase family protein [Pseudomonas chlororaphis]|uniref:hydroxypyruvate isomerase family protein n=1 Tax=Pseudomonas chlororaphis TaxID=587753 RepID=UPI001B300771|nr:TIM barrel protein [Pseudomonas chlororaphis]MBP5072430.1 TIM barrel protein [Pseudomonas chlororaphis]QTT88387.1 TIM barrel protein [Pseudomonas chlororaphis]
MLKFNAHLGFQFNELPFLQRIEAAAAAGFRAVEFPSPYEFDASLLADHLAQHSLSLIQFAAPAGVTKGIAALQGKEEEFRSGLLQAARYAKALACPDVHIMSGVTTQDEAALIFEGNLEYAVKYFEDQGLRPLIEVISSQEVPGYYMSDFNKAQQVLEAFPSVGLILDLYHAQLLTADAGDVLARFYDRTVHVQIADCPGRHEPGTGNIDFAALFAALEQRGYPGWIGCEYRPSGFTVASLDWIKQLGA